MVTDQDTGLSSASVRRSDAGVVRFTARDIAGLTLTGDMCGAPYDLLGMALGVEQARLRAIVARWRRAGLAESGRIGPGPGWCWLTTTGMRAAGLRYVARRPSLARLAHIRAVLAVRLSLEASGEGAQGAAWWRSERRIRSAAARLAGIGHVPDAEVIWPDLPASPYPDQCWAVEVELTPKATARTTAIMTELLARRFAWEPAAPPGPRPRYDQVTYLCSPAALPAVHRGAAALPPALAARVEITDLPEGALL